MSKLKINREKLNLTQQELSEKSGISVRTIQRIESGIEPQGQTLKRLAKTLEINESALLQRETPNEEKQIHFEPTICKVINFSSLPFTIFPPVNIIIPLIIMYAKKQFNPLTKKIITIQILWLIFAVIVFMLSAFSKKMFSLESNNHMLVVMISLVLINLFIILRNSKEIDKKASCFLILISVLFRRLVFFRKLTCVLTSLIS